jgi:hypothetical protein
MGECMDGWMDTQAESKNGTRKERKKLRERERTKK